MATVGEFIQDELEARGWSTADLALHMGGDALIDELALDILLLGEPDIMLGDEMAAGLSRAFDTSAEFWIKLDALARSEAMLKRCSNG